ncbi:MAG TPA: hypothetical protein VLN61_07640 [Pseudolabrys sp.]|nr:hypothetical protein [Pseudolabrys sp.]
MRRQARDHVQRRPTHRQQGRRAGLSQQIGDPAEASRYRSVDLFTTGQISNASVYYTLRQVDDDHIEMNMQSGGTLKLQRCE